MSGGRQRTNLLNPLNQAFFFDSAAYGGAGAIGIGGQPFTQAQVWFGLPAYTGTSNVNNHRVSVSPQGTLTIPASSTSAAVATLNLSEPDITLGSGAAVTDAYTLRISGAPTEGLHNGSLWIVAGAARFDDQIVIKQGTNQSIGVATLSGNGSVNVSSTRTNSDSAIFISPFGSAPVGSVAVTTRTNSVGFTVASSSAADTRTFAWWIIDRI